MGPVSKRNTTKRTKKSANKNASGSETHGVQKRARTRSPSQRGPAVGEIEHVSQNADSPAPSPTAAPACEETYEGALAALSDQQADFVREYVVKPNASDAARRAGYATKSAGVAGCRLLKNDKIQAAVAAGRAFAGERYEIDLDRVVGELAFMACGDPTDIATAVDDDGAPISISQPTDIGKLAPHLRKLIAGWSWDRMGNFVLKFHDKRAALETLGRHYGMGTGNLTVDVTPLMSILNKAKARARAEGFDLESDDGNGRSQTTH